MQVSEALQRRISIRQFLSDPVDRQQVTEILNVARRSPSGGNLQPWRVIAVAGAERQAVIELARKSLAPGAVELPDAALHAAGEFEVVLYWLALKSTLQTDYTVTLQMFAADGRRIAQLDTFPVRGMYPTSQWLGNQWLRDTYSLRIAPDAPPGPATLIVGLYERTTNKALQVVQPDGRRAGRLTLAQLEIR